MPWQFNRHEGISFRKVQNGCIFFKEWIFFNGNFGIILSIIFEKDIAKDFFQNAALLIVEVRGSVDILLF